jgi:hypothetical protein
MSRSAPRHLREILSRQNLPRQRFLMLTDRYSLTSSAASAAARDDYIHA